MRSRYTAYTMVRVDYITDTLDPRSRDNHDPDQAKKWAEESEWLGLDILSTDAGGPGRRKRHGRVHRALSTRGHRPWSTGSEASS